MDVRNRHVLVTGGSRGIGEQLARKFAAAGARVSITARSGDELDRIARDINGVAFRADLLDAHEVEGLIAKVEAEVGPIDILVNNAGLDTADAFAKIEPSVIRNVVRVNLEAPMVLTRQVIPGMIKRGGGHLVFLSSLAGTGSFPGLAAYCGTKAGLNNFVATLRLELGAYPIKTTLVAPAPSTRVCGSTLRTAPTNRSCSGDSGPSNSSPWPSPTDSHPGWSARLKRIVVTCATLPGSAPVIG